MPKLWVLFLPFISHLRYGLSANHNTSTCKTYKEGNHISHLHCHYSSRSCYYFSPDLLHQLPEWYSHFYPCSPSDYLNMPIKVIVWRHTSGHITPLLKPLQWPSSYPQGFDIIRAPIAFNIIPSHFPICFLRYSHPGFLAVPSMHLNLELDISSTWKAFPAEIYLVNFLTSYSLYSDLKAHSQ